MRFLFVTVVPKYLNFATFSKDLLVVSKLWILSCIHTNLLFTLFHMLKVPGSTLRQEAIKSEAFRDFLSSSRKRTW